MGVVETVRILTDAEVANEVRDIETNPWPLGDVLPVKQFYLDYHLGNIFRVDGKIVPTVHETPHIDEHDPKFAYGSVEEMVRAGWIPD